MLIELCSKGMDTAKKWYLVTNLIAMCNLNNVDVMKNTSSNIPGCLGKSKGML